MDADAPETPSSADAKAAQADEHERDVEDREAFEAWGYMFKPDKTGTDKLKALLRGLKNVIVCLAAAFYRLLYLALVRLTTPRTNITNPPITRI